MTRIEEIIRKYFSQHADSKTQRLFAKWLDSPFDSELKDVVLQEQWEKEYYISPEAVNKSYKSVMKRISRPQSSTFLRRYLPWIWAGAASVVSIAMLWSILTAGPSDESSVEVMNQGMTECYVANGEKQMIMLADSTTVILNSGSLLIYPEQFSANNREVYLSGEAIFNVTKDESHPFIVKTPDFYVKVLGTVFNVNSYPDAEYATATLKEGSVSISAEGKDAWLLSPNQTLTYSRETHKISIEQSDVSEAFGWKDGKLCFRSSSIHSIVKTIERYYGMRVYLTTEKYDSELITAKFIHGESIDEMLSALRLIIPDMKYEIANHAVYIK